MTKELKIAYEKLKELDRVKSEFVSFASHQVKTPMTVIKGYASMIADGTYGAVSEKIKETSEKIIEATDRLVALVNNILNVRKIEEGKLEYTFEETDMSALVTSVVSDLAPSAKGKGIELSLSVAPRVPPVRADSLKLRQVIQNVIDNAVKYTAEGSVKVSVSHEETGKEVLISVADSGSGMEPPELKRLFEPFHRDALTAKTTQGSGLGLYIAKQIMNAHQGAIWATSEGIGKGSSFFIRIPTFGSRG